MALHLKVSNSLESLAGGLSGNLSDARGNVFAPSYIVTQTEGMNNWLKLQMSVQLGIAANYRFLRPNEFINHLYFLLNGQTSETLSRENLHWLLFQLMGEQSFIDKFPEIAEYYEGNWSATDLRRMALAEKVADLFDQYQIYRPEMILEWNRTSLTSVPEGEWQQYLWVNARLKAGNALPDKTVIADYILSALKDTEQQEILKRRLPAIHLFGLSIITAYHIRILFQLSSSIDVYFHIINPAPALYWLEDRSDRQLALWRQKGKDVTGLAVGNALLTGWGHVIRDTLGMLFAHDEFLNAYEEVAVTPPRPDTLLRKIQHDVFSAATEERQLILPGDIRDDSILINSCYTIAREVEALYNYLVYLVDEKEESLSPRDIVVMVSDIDTYVPYIKAVFNNVPYPFRYTIADESYADGDNLFAALRSILLLNEENFTSEAVVQLLDFSYIRDRFGITDPGLIRRLVSAASIRFGIQGSLDDDTRLVSWTYGLKRIMYGIAMSGEERYGESDEAFYPLDFAEGGEALLIIRFCHFVGLLMDSIRERSALRSLSEWAAYIESVVHHLIFEPDEASDEHYELLLRQLSALNLSNQYMSEKIGFGVIAHNLLQSLDSADHASLFAGGGITFCSLIPMRSIPFRVVAMLGLDYDKFPRREKSIGFNLMERDPQKGDRNIKENDKHLFLETVLSAKDYLYISYLGQSPNDNTMMPPSSLIDELIDYIEAGMSEQQESIRRQLITQQPLQGFSRKYGAGDPGLYNYLESNVRPVEKKILPDKPMEALNFDEILLDDLIRFFRNPFKAYYNKVLGIFYEDESVLLDETELFGLDKLQQWNIRQQLLPAVNVAALQDRLVKTGQLPLKNMASVIVQEAEEAVEPVRTLYSDYIDGSEGQVLPVSVVMGESVLTGTLRPVFDGKLLQVSLSKGETKYLVEAYIRYLSGAAADVLSGVAFLSGANHLAIFEGTPMSSKEARRRLQELIAIYKEGFEQIIPYFSDFKIAPEEVAELGLDGFLKLIEKTIHDYHYPCDDPYVLSEYRSGYFENEALLEKFIQVCQKIIVPLPDFFPDYFAQTKKK